MSLQQPALPQPTTAGMTITEPTISKPSLGVTPIPIRVHTGPQRRGRKLSDVARFLIGQAVMSIQKSKSEGLPVSVREAAEKFNVPKSTLHRYLRNSHSPTKVSARRPYKLGIPFLLQSDVPTAVATTHYPVQRKTSAVPMLQEEIGTLQSKVKFLENRPAAGINERRFQDSLPSLF